MDFEKNNNPGILRQSMYYGAILGVGLVLVTIIFYLLGKSNSRFQTFFNYIVITGSIISGIRDYRDEHSDGYISYKESLLTGSLIAFFGALINGVFTYLIISVFDPAVLAVLKEKLELELANSQYASYAPEEKTKAIDFFTQPGIVFLFVIFYYTFLGFFFSLIISIFMKRTEAN